VSFVLDTNAVSAVIKGDARTLSRLRDAVKSEVLVPQPVLAEISYGIARLPKSRRKESLRQRFELVKSELLRADWTDAVSEAFGDIKAHLERRGTRIEDFDAAIAAHAHALGAVLVTSNLTHMIRIPGLRVEDWAK
jgi:tRNA(fMet)-specific endonuclease VapC